MNARLIGVVGDPQSPSVMTTSSMLAVITQGLWVPSDFPVRLATHQMFGPYLEETMNPYKTDLGRITLPDHRTTLETVKQALHEWGEQFPSLWQGMMQAVLSHDLQTHPAVVVNGIETDAQAAVITGMGGVLLQVLEDLPTGQMELLPAKGSFVRVTGDQDALEMQLKAFLYA